MSGLIEKGRRAAALSWHERFNLAALFWYRVKGMLFYRRILGSFGRKSAIYPPALIGGARFIHIGDRVTIRKGARIEAVLVDPANPPEIRIGNDVNIEQDVHIVAMGRICIHDNVSITARASLLCGNHPFFDVRNPVKIGARLAGSGSSIEIGAGSLLGVGSVVQMNVKVGRHVVVGSNSVVKRSTPDYCVVDGNPAAVVLRYNQDEDQWQPPEKAAGS
jgi:acetyltransferase-like isoleucine patch superfamily enzyme